MEHIKRIFSFWTAWMIWVFGILAKSRKLKQFFLHYSLVVGDLGR